MLGYFMQLLFPAALVFGFHFVHFPPPSYMGGVVEVKKKDHDVLVLRLFTPRFVHVALSTYLGR